MGDEDSRKIFVGGTRDADEKTVEDYFQQFGAIESCKVISWSEISRRSAAVLSAIVYKSARN